MLNYEIFDLLYSNLRHKFEDDHLVFTQKYTVDRQRISICCLRDKEKPNVVECLDFLNKLQEKYYCCLQLKPFYFSHSPLHHNIVVYQFLSENEEEVRMYEHFCLLAISFSKKMTFQKEHDLVEEYFYYHLGENLGFTHNVLTNFFACYVSVKSGNVSFNGDLERKNFDKLFEEYNLASEGWSKFMYRIEAVPTWSSFDYEFVAISKKS